MRIHKLLFSMLLLVALLPLLGGILGFYQSFREKEAGRAEELAENMFANLISRIEDIVEKVDMIIQWEQESGTGELTDGRLYSMLSHLHIQHVMRLEGQPHLGGFSERIIISHRANVDGRSYNVALMARSGELLPSLRISIQTTRIGDVMALYFSPRVLMDYNLADGATVMAYNENQKISGVIYPVTLYGTTNSSIILQSQLLQEFLNEQEEMPDTFTLDEHYYVTPYRSHGTGLLIGRKIAPWSAFGWLPGAYWWWGFMLVGVTTSLIISYILVCRYVSRPVKVIADLVEDRSVSPDEIKGFSSSPWIPKEFRSLMRQVRYAISMREASKGVLGAGPVRGESFIKDVQQAISTSTASHQGLILLVMRSIESSRYALSQEYQKERLDQVIEAANDHYSLDQNNLGLVNFFFGEKDSSGLWIWIESSTPLEVAAGRLLSYLESRFNDTLFRYCHPEIYFVNQDKFSVAKDLVQCLLHSSRDERCSYSNERLIGIDDERVMWCRHETILTKLAKRGFHANNILLKITPVVKNSTGEVYFFRLSPHAKVDNETFEVRSGEWMLRDYRGSYLNELIHQTIQMARILDQSGFSLVRLALPLSLRCLEHPQILSKLTDIESKLSSRIILEVSAQPLNSRHFQLMRDLSSKGVGIAASIGPGCHGSLGIPKTYTFIQASHYNSMAQLYHQTLLERRKLGELVIDLDNASDMLRTSAFHRPDDYSKITHETNLSLHDAIKFLQQDISLNVLRTKEIEVSEDPAPDIPNNVVQLITSSRS